MGILIVNSSLLGGLSAAFFLLAALAADLTVSGENSVTRIKSHNTNKITAAVPARRSEGPILPVT